eukprot:SAG22_NODE_5229_length_1057_cov_1.397704_2_plen_71_part_00
MKMLLGVAHLPPIADSVYALDREHEVDGYALINRRNETARAAFMADANLQVTTNAISKIQSTKIGGDDVR